MRWIGVSRGGQIDATWVLWVSLWVALVIGFGAFILEPIGRPTPSANLDQLAAGKVLYTQQCAACHGDQGDGNGPAARFLYPRPRNFGEAKFRLATTVNSMPTDDDLMRIITRGMPGSAMFPFGHLSEVDRKSLVAYVREVTRSSFVESARREAEKAGEKLNPIDLARDAAEVLKPGDLVAIPTVWPKADELSIGRGKTSYLKTCAACHGLTGKGDGVQDQKNGDGTPTAPRDFTRGIFKGSRDREQLFVRIALGMAGTPMPATQGASSEEMCDLVNFIQSLSTPDAQTRVEHRRTTLTARRASGSLADPIPESTWSASPPAQIVVSPLWWRNYAEPSLTVRALHDGKTLVLRFNWHDDTCNDRIIKPDDFEDMAAVQLFRGQAEPFLGMGAADSALDLWLWRASWQKPRDFSANQADDYPFDTPYYRERLKAVGKAAPDMQTAHAAGNPHSRTDPNFSAANLSAKGFGSTTFRPRVSQLVTAKSNWSNGNWTVELRRPLAVATDDGLALAPGSRCSIRFALWDGAAHDRNGQKLVSIWHDLRLEQ